MNNFNIIEKERESLKLKKNTLSKNNKGNCEKSSEEKNRTESEFKTKNKQKFKIRIYASSVAVLLLRCYVK